MLQTKLTSFFSSRKRPASEVTKRCSEDIICPKAKVINVNITTNYKHESSLENNSDNITEGLFLDRESNVRRANHKKNFITGDILTHDVGLRCEGASTAVQSARKELSLGDIKKRLVNSSRLTELKDKAEHLHKRIKLLKETSTHKKLNVFDSIEVCGSPIKQDIQNEFLSPKKQSKKAQLQEDTGTRVLMSPRRVFVSPVKSPRKTPAYMKQTEEEAKGSSLSLPSEYRHLAELFQGMETIVSLMYNKNEKVTLEKLKKSVQTMLKRNFTEKHLAQIKQLVPDFYNFEMKKCKQFSTSTQRESYQLVITPNFPNDIKVMNPSVLLERRRHFANVLLQLVKKHHAQFLLTLEPPIVLSEDKVVRWHPEFDTEKIPHVESARLPEAPNTEKFSTVQDFNSNNHKLFKINAELMNDMKKLTQLSTEDVLKEDNVYLRDSSSSTSSATQTSTPSSSNVVILNPALRNLPPTLLEKVKAKQAAKALAAMTRSPEVEKKYMIYSRLPELAKTLRNIYVTERKNVLALNVVLSKLEYSFKSTAVLAELRDDIKVLCEEVPQFVQIHDIRNDIYLKLDRFTSLQKVISGLETLAEHFKC